MTSIIKVDQIQTAAGGVPTTQGLGVLGGIVSVSQALNQTRSSLVNVANDFVDVTGLSVTVTPASANSKFLIFMRVFGEGPAPDAHNISIALFRDSTNVNAGLSTGVTAQSVISTAGSDYYNGDTSTTPQVWNATTLDSPNTTSPITYKVRMTNQGGTDTFWLNGTVSGDIAAYAERGSSELIVLELNV